TRTYEVVGNGIKLTAEGVGPNGERIAYTYTATSDGKDYPLTGTGQPSGADTIAVKRISASTRDATLKKAGKVVQTSHSVVSKDGKTLTITSHGTNANGQKTTATQVFEKQ